MMIISCLTSFCAAQLYNLSIFTVRIKVGENPYFFYLSLKRVNVMPMVTLCILRNIQKKVQMEML